MKNLFPQFYRLADSELAELFKSAVFIFDANMLLHLYRYPKKARDDLLRILVGLSSENRLWLPYQSALEFQSNRLSVISDQREKYGKVNTVISDIESRLRKELDALELRKRHSSIDPDILLEEISASFNKYRAQLTQLESEQLDVHHEDSIRSEIEKLFAERIGSPFSSEEIEGIFKEGAVRYKAKRPPGYADEDEKKGTYIIDRGMYVKREFGDLIVWKEILQFIKGKKPQGVIFVTDDNKQDWWLRVNGKTVGPRPELLSEVFSEAGLSNFYIYNSERFMSLASQHLGIHVEKDSIEQVKTISSERVKLGNRLYKENRVRLHLVQMYGDRCQICSFDGASEAASIIPVSEGGARVLGNTLLLCPNHHKTFDRGAFSVNDDFTLLGLDGSLRVDQNHEISVDSLKFHRENVYRRPETD
ncbi:PIN-like domain-containing protein [Paraburkholderia sp. WC7.3g]|uniref:PIN-like domain-containing protein n=1 Tax=Paraburkholderia sp. WC7.3g TaxID=2991070 RepID=UPI003D19F0D7